MMFAHLHLGIQKSDGRSSSSYLAEILKRQNIPIILQDFLFYKCSRDMCRVGLLSESSIPNPCIKHSM
jgi:hypothetical protein